MFFYFLCVVHKLPSIFYYGLLLGTIKRDTQMRIIKNKKTEHINHNHRGTVPSSFDPSGPRTQVPTRPNPQGLGREFRLARPPRASDPSSDSPDPSGPRTQVPTRPTPQGLGRKFRLARPLRVSDASSVLPDPFWAQAPNPAPPGQQDFHHTAPVPTK